MCYQILQMHSAFQTVRTTKVKLDISVAYTVVTIFLQPLFNSKKELFASKMKKV